MKIAMKVEKAREQGSVRLVHVFLWKREANGGK